MKHEAFQSEDFKLHFPANSYNQFQVWRTHPYHVQTQALPAIKFYVCCLKLICACASNKKILMLLFTHNKQRQNTRILSLKELTKIQWRLKKCHIDFRKHRKFLSCIFQLLVQANTRERHSWNSSLFSTVLTPLV